MSMSIPIRHSRPSTWLRINFGGNPSYGLDFKAWISVFAGMTSDLRGGVQS